VSAEHQRLATSIEELRRQRDELQKANTPSANPVSPPATERSAAPAKPSEQRAPTASPSESFSALSRRLGGKVGLAYAPVGIGRPAKSLGDLSGGVGWSTMKIPVAVATVRRANGHPGQATLGLMSLAITRSDNDAAMEL
jgi:hypothetical protein